MSNCRINIFEPGNVLNNKWVILELIGKGAMGEIYLAHQLNLKRDVAIKVVSEELLKDFEDDPDEIETAFQRFKREVHAMARVRHPNVLQIFDYGSAVIQRETGDCPVEFIAMEYIPGDTLRFTMSEEGFYPEQELTRDWLEEYFLPLLDGIDIQGKEITADALLTQRRFACYLVEDRRAHYHFTVKGNQPQLFEDIRLYFEDRREPDFVVDPSLEHGRIETRKIWTTSALNDYLDFPHVGQAFVIERQRIEKKTGKDSTELAYGITSRTPEQADAQQVLETNRGHWSVENCCHYTIDWNFDEDRSRIRKGHGPENIRRLRHFAISIIKSKGVRSVEQ